MRLCTFVIYDYGYKLLTVLVKYKRMELGIRLLVCKIVMNLEAVYFTTWNCQSGTFMEVCRLCMSSVKYILHNIPTLPWKSL